MLNSEITSRWSINFDKHVSAHVKHCNGFSLAKTFKGYNGF
jgi:hypothetical protein